MKKLIVWALIASLMAACAPGAALCEEGAAQQPAASEEARAPEPSEVEAPAQSAPEDGDGAGETAAQEAPSEETPPPEGTRAPEDGGEGAIEATEAPAQDEPDAAPGEDAPDDVQPEGQAWALLEDGSLLDGSLQSVLRTLLEDGESTTVYVTRLGEFRLRGIPMDLFDRVRLEPDEGTLGEDRGPYEIDIEEGELPPDAEEDAVPPVTVTVRRANARPTPDPGESPEETPPPADDPAEEPAPSDGPTIEPAIELAVEVEGLLCGEWQNVPPVFTLSGVEPGTPYVYGVFICGERLVLLKDGQETYAPSYDEGELNFRFAVLDMMGDVVALSRQFDVWLDMTPPDGPYISVLEESDIVAQVEAYDALSGVCAISVNGGETWREFDEEIGDCIVGVKGELVEPGDVLVRDRAGNVSANAEAFTFGRIKKGGGSGKTIKHVAQSMDYSLANYNALELDFPREPVTELTAGGTPLALTMTADVGGLTQTAAFSAQLTNWRADEDDERGALNALVLTAAREDSSLNTWSFSGDVYRLLYNSGVEYLVFASGDYITAVSTAGFTGGTAYAKMKAGGVSTRHFGYRLCQDEALRETTLSVEVGGETYLLEEDRSQPMYRYDVLVGVRDMMGRPFASYLPENRAEEEPSDE